MIVYKRIGLDLLGGFGYDPDWIRIKLGITRSATGRPGLGRGESQVDHSGFLIAIWDPGLWLPQKSVLTKCCRTRLIVVVGLQFLKTAWLPLQRPTAAKTGPR